jgi:hypothetical protein
VLHGIIGAPQRRQPDREGCYFDGSMASGKTSMEGKRRPALALAGGLGVLRQSRANRVGRCYSIALRCSHGRSMDQLLD